MWPWRGVLPIGIYEMFIVLLVDEGLVWISEYIRGLMVVSVWAGSKRTCPPSDLADGEGSKSTCISSKGIHNFAYPRTGISFLGAMRLI